MVLVRQAFDIFALIFFVLFVSACERPRQSLDDVQMQAYLAQFEKAVLNVQFVESNQHQHEVVLLFNQPMVGFSEIGRITSNVSNVKVSPLVVGEFEWIEPQVLVFRPRDPAHNNIKLTVEAGWQSLLGTGLLRDVAFEWIRPAQKTSHQNAKLELPPLQITTQSLLWPRDTQTPQIESSLTSLQLLWRMPSFVSVGDRLQGQLQVVNGSTAPFKGHITIVAENVMTPIARELELAPKAEITLPIDISVSEAIQTHILNSFLKNNLPFLEVPITITCQNVRGTQVLQKPLKIYSILDFENKDYLGVLAGVQKQKVLSESFERLQSGQLSLDFSLDAYELLNTLVMGLKESPTDDLLAKALSLSPYVIFPKSTLAFGLDEAAWQTHLDDVRQFLDELRSSLQFQVGRMFSGPQLLLFGEFVALARETGFDVDDLQSSLSELLQQDLNLETNLNQKIAILWVLSRLQQDQPESYNQAYLSWNTLEPLAQMQLGEMILQMNPLHPVARQIRRSVDKILFNQTPQPVTFWAQAFRTLLLVNLDDNLNFEVFAQVFINLENHRSLINDYAVLVAFRLYQVKFTKIDKPVDLTVLLNGHEIMKSNLSWKNRSDGLILPVEKLPKQVVLAAQKKSGPFAFYRLHLKGLRLVSKTPIEDFGIRVTQSCYDEQGQPQQTLIKQKTYNCRVRWVVSQMQDNVLFEIPRLTGATLEVDDLPMQSIVSLQGSKLKVFYQQLKEGYGEFSYQLRPDFTIESQSRSLRVSSTLGGFWGGRFLVKPTSVKAP